MTLIPGDPLAHRALESLLRAEASVRRRLSSDLEREGLSASGFSVLVVLTTAGGALELRTLRHRLRTSKANATEVVGTLEARGLVERKRDAADKRVVTVALTPAGREKLLELRSRRTDFLAGHMTGLGADELARLRAALPVLDQILESATA